MAPLWRLCCALAIVGAGCDAVPPAPEQAAPPAASAVESVVAQGEHRIAPANGNNILVIMLDDISTHQVQVYGAHPNQPPTPTITRLASEGVRFDMAYAYASCSPARASMLTGRFPSRFGIGKWIDGDNENFSMPLAEVTIPEMLDQGVAYDYTTALIGKWHLSAYSYPGAAFAPLDQGFDWSQGSIENLGSALTSDGMSRNYFHWERITNGVPEFTDDYATTRTIDDALRHIHRMPEPWFMYLSLNAPHIPLHVPPADLHTQVMPPVPCGTNAQMELTCYNAMVEAADTEIARFLDTVDPVVLANTTIILTSDNGTPDHGIAPPFDSFRDKGTMYDGGVKVPLIVTGPYVTNPGAVSQAFVSLTDVFATVAQIAGVDLATVTTTPGGPVVELDAESFLDQVVDPTLPGHGSRATFVSSELFRDNGAPPYYNREIMIRMADRKLVTIDGVEEMYYYDDATPDEGPDVFETSTAERAQIPPYWQLTDLTQQYATTFLYEGP